MVEMYREGKWPETPDGIQKENFHKMIRSRARIEDLCETPNFRLLKAGAI